MVLLYKHFLIFQHVIYLIVFTLESYLFYRLNEFNCDLSFTDDNVELIARCTQLAQELQNQFNDPIITDISNNIHRKAMLAAINMLKTHQTCESKKAREQMRKVANALVLFHPRNKADYIYLYEASILLAKTKGLADICIDALILKHHIEILNISSGNNMYILKRIFKIMTEVLLHKGIIYIFFCRNYYLEINFHSFILFFISSFY